MKFYHPAGHYKAAAKAAEAAGFIPGKGANDGGKTGGGKTGGGGGKNGGGKHGGGKRGEAKMGKARKAQESTVEARMAGEVRLSSPIATSAGSFVKSILGFMAKGSCSVCRTMFPTVLKGIADMPCEKVLVTL